MSSSVSPPEWPPLLGSSRAGAVEEAHQEDLETLLDLVRATVELESRCDYADPHGGPEHNREAFLAHFSELDASLAAWDERVERVRAAPAGLWEWFAGAAVELGISEPPFAVGALVDRLAVLTVDRSRRGQLRAPHELSLERFKDTLAGQKYLSVYLEGQRVASLRYPPEGDCDDQAATAERLIQRLFDQAQACEEAQEIDNARDAMLDLKQHLLSMLAQCAAADPVAFAPDCPVCQSRLRAERPD